MIVFSRFRINCDRVMKMLFAMMPLLALCACSGTSEPVEVSTLPVDEVTVKVDSVEPGVSDSRFALDHHDARVVRLIFAGTQPQNGATLVSTGSGKPDGSGLAVVDFGKEEFYVYQDLHVHGLDIGQEDKEVLYGVFSKYTSHFRLTR